MLSPQSLPSGAPPRTLVARLLQRTSSNEACLFAALKDSIDDTLCFIATTSPSKLPPGFYSHFTETGSLICTLSILRYLARVLGSADDEQCYHPFLVSRAARFHTYLFARAHKAECREARPHSSPTFEGPSLLYYHNCRAYGIVLSVPPNQPEKWHPQV